MRTLSYADLELRANQLAHELRTRGVGPEARVGVLIERSVESVVALLGVLKAGAVYLPLDPAFSDTRLRWMLADARPQVLLTAGRQAVPSGPWAWLDLQADQASIQGQPEHPPGDVRSTPEQTAYMIYTSGSTGRPKGVLVPHRGLVNLAQAQIAAFAVTAASRVLQFAALSFDASLSEIAITLLSGATLVLAVQEELRTRLGALLEERAVSVVTLPPSALATLASERLATLRTVVSAGEPCSTDLIARWASERLFINAYGPTETSVCATLGRRMPGDAPLIGQPLENALVCILDQRMQPLPVGVPGELYVGGVGLAHGYHDRPDLTAERFVPNPFGAELAIVSPRLYKTGDRARWRADGQIEFLGRLDQQIKLRGYRIEPGEIEAALREHPQIDDALVALREDQVGAPRLVAYLIPTGQPGALTPVVDAVEVLALPPFVADLRAALLERLPDYMLPSAFVALPRFPLNPNGKIDRAALPPPDGLRPALEQPLVAPRTPPEAELARIWSTVLGVSQVGVHDNFFELGGDSILWLQVIARARAAGMHLRQRAIATAATIAELAELAQHAPAPVAASVAGPDAPLGPIQCWFFAQEFPDQQHWNQALLLRASVPLDAGALAQALNYLMHCHEALRLRFERGPAGWRQYDAGVVPLALDLIDQRDLAMVEREQAIRAHAAELHRLLDLSHGPLLRAALFRGAADQPDLLLLLLHHLIVDGVSWRVLLDDLQSAYRQIGTGRAIELPAATPLSDWTRWLTKPATMSELAQDQHYWLALEQVRPPLLPRDMPEGDHREASAAVLTSVLDREQTLALTRSGQVNAVLLAALLQVFGEWMGAADMLIDLEGHGRDVGLEGPDVSRTVGWCTAAYPVLLHGMANGSPSQQIDTVSQQLAQIPRGGVGYGLLRYHSPDQALRQRLAALPRPEVCFNYLGRFDQTVGTQALFQIAQTACPPLRSPLAPRTHLIEIDCFIIADVLQIDWTYSRTLHRRDTIAGLAARFGTALKTLLVAPKAPSAADFPNARISQQQLDRLLSRLSQGKAEPRP